MVVRDFIKGQPVASLRAAKNADGAWNAAAFCATLAILAIGRNGSSDNPPLAVSGDHRCRVTYSFQISPAVKSPTDDD